MCTLVARGNRLSHNARITVNAYKYKCLRRLTPFFNRCLTRRYLTEYLLRELRSALWILATEAGNNSFRFWIKISNWFTHGLRMSDWKPVCNQAPSRLTDASTWECFLVRSMDDLRQPWNIFIFFKYFPASSKFYLFANSL